MTRRQAPTVIRLKRRRAFLPASEIASLLAKPKTPRHPEAGPPAKVEPVEATNPVAQAEVYFDARLVYRPSGERFLDGTPCDLDRMMKTYNTERERQGKKPVGNNSRWRP